MPLYREKIFLVAVKTEGVSGVENAPNPLTESIATVGIPTLEVDYLESGDRGDVQTGILSAADDAGAAGRFGRISLRLEARGLGSTYSSGAWPEAHYLFLISGLAGTFASAAWTYTTVDSGDPTATLHCFSAGKKFILVGCKARPKFSAAALKRGFLDFDVIGRLAADPTEVAVPTYALMQKEPPLFHSATAQIGGWLSTAGSDPLMLLSASIDLGNVISELPSAGATDGHAGYIITDRTPTQELVFNAGPLASLDVFAASKAAGAAGALLTAWQLGTVTNNKIKFEARWKPRAPREGSASGVKQYTVNGPMRVGTGLTGGREILITYS